MAKSSILARLRESDLVPEPFPHLVVRDALDPDYYAELARTFPAMSIIAGDQPLANNRAYRLPAPRALSEPEVPAVWREVRPCASWSLPGPRRSCTGARTSSGWSASRSER